MTPESCDLSRLGELQQQPDAETEHTGFITLDYLMGGGWPVGRRKTVLIVGEAGIGKTSLAVYLALHMAPAGAMFIPLDNDDPRHVEKLTSIPKLYFPRILPKMYFCTEEVTAKVAQGDVSQLKGAMWRSCPLVIDSLESLPLGVGQDVIKELRQKVEDLIVTTGTRRAPQGCTVMSGWNSAYFADVILYIQKSNYRGLKYVSVTKNRFGECGSFYCAFGRPGGVDVGEAFIRSYPDFFRWTGSTFDYVGEKAPFGHYPIGPGKAAAYNNIYQRFKWGQEITDVGHPHYFWEDLRAEMKRRRDAKEIL